MNIKFLNASGLLLSARLTLPPALKPRAYAIFAHCFTCNKNFKAVKQISQALTQSGFGVLSFDFTGLGGSEGEFSESNFSTNVSDLLAAAEYLKNEYYSPQLLIGHSLGGAAVLFAAKRIESVQAVATIGSPGEVGHVKHLFQHVLEEIKSEGQAEVHVGPQKITVKEQFIMDLDEADLSSEVATLDRALLILHSPQDLVVPIEEAARLYHAAKHPKSFVSLDGADHVLREAADGAYAGQVIASWANRYIDFEQDEWQPDSQVFVRLDEEDKFTSEVRARHHQLLADEPKDVNGADLGPTPYELLQASLGTCTAMTLHMYARRKKWPLEEVRVSLNFNRRHTTDSAGYSEKNSFIHDFEVILELEGDLTEEQRQKCLEIAHKCPVHRTLVQEKEIRVRLSD